MSTTRRPAWPWDRLALGAFVAIAAIAASLVTASGQEGPASEGIGISFCDFDGSDGESEEECQKSLIAPEGADVVDVEGEQPAPGTGAIAPTPPASPEPESPPAFDGPTGPYAHAGIDGEDAQALFTDANEPLISALSTEAIPSDAQILSTSSRSAVIDIPGEPTSVVDSNVPLFLGPDSDVPVDLGLEHAGGTYSPQTPIVDVSLPDDAYEPASLNGVGVDLAYAPEVPSGGSDGNEGSLVGEEGVFYPEADLDTDLFVTPQPAGYELFAQIRSANGPEELHFDVTVPSGATLQEAPAATGGAEVIDDSTDDVLAQISPPIATDADGDSVAVSMSVDDGQLVVDVPHVGSGAAYPILVDPSVTDAYNWSAGAGFTGWASVKTDSDYGQAQNLLPNTGIYNYVDTSKTLSANTAADWYYLIPHYGSTSTAYIDGAWMQGVYSIGSSSQTTPKMLMGLYKPGTSTWADSAVWSGNTSLTNVAITGGAGATRADFELYTTTSTTTNSSRAGRVAIATLALTDSDNPATSLTGGPTTWTNGSTPSYSITTNGTDGGLGVKTETFVSGYDEDGDAVSEPTQTSSCAGTAASPCPQSWAPSYTMHTSDLRDGLQTTAAGVVDITGKAAIYGRHFGIDRIAPTVKSVAVDTDLDGSATIEVDAEDGSPGSRSTSDEDDMAGAQSGVDTVDIEYGSEDDSDSQDCLGDGIDGNGTPSAEVPWASCEMDSSFDAPDGIDGQPVDVVATDQVGNTSTDGPPSLEVGGPALDHPDGWIFAGEQELSVTATDEDLGDDGLASITVKLDGDTVFSDGGCATDCTFDETVDFNTSEEASGAHTLTVAAEDGDGNVSSRSYDLKLDSKPPVLDVSGDLADLEGEELVNRFNDLDIDASDPDDGTNDSGILGLQVIVDNVVVHSEPSVCAPSCPATDSYEYTYDRDAWDPGGHSLRVAAVDQAGNITEVPISANYVMDEAEAECPDVDTAPAASGTVTTTAAESLFEDYLPEAVESSTSTTVDVLDDEETYSPSVGSGSSSASPYIGTSTGGWVEDTADGGQMVGDSLCVRPADASSSATTGVSVAGGDAVLYANTQDYTDTLVRPAAQGSIIVGQLRSSSAPSTFEYQVNLESGQHLEEMDNGSVAVVEDITDPEEDLHTPTPDSGTASDAPTEAPDGIDTVEDLADAGAQLEKADYYMSEAQQGVEDGEDIVGVVSAPIGVDSTGMALPASVSATGDKVTVDLSRTGATYPVYYATNVVARTKATCHAHAFPPNKFRRDPTPVGGGPRPSIWFEGKFDCQGNRPDALAIYVELRQRKFAGPFGYWDEVEDIPIFKKDDKYHIGAGNFDDCKKSSTIHRFITTVKAGAHFPDNDFRRDDDDSNDVSYYCDQ